MKILLNITEQAVLGNVKNIIDHVISTARNENLDQKKLLNIELAMEEILVNICEYAYPDAPGAMEITWIKEINHFIIEIKDSGIPFNPLALEKPDILVPLEDRKIGGMGIPLVRNIADDIKYERIKNQNVLTLIMT